MPPAQLEDDTPDWRKNPPSYNNAMAFLANSHTRSRDDHKGAVCLRSHLHGLRLCSIQGCTEILAPEPGGTPRKGFWLRIGPEQELFTFVICQEHTSDVKLSDIYESEEAATQICFASKKQGARINLYGWDLVFEHCSFGFGPLLEPCNRICKGDEEPRGESDPPAERNQGERWVCIDAGCWKKAAEWAKSESLDTQAGKRRADESEEGRRKHQRVWDL